MRSRGNAVLPQTPPRVHVTVCRPRGESPRTTRRRRAHIERSAGSDQADAPRRSAVVTAEAGRDQGSGDCAPPGRLPGRLARWRCRSLARGRAPGAAESPRRAPDEGDELVDQGIAQARHRLQRLFQDEAAPRQESVRLVQVAALGGLDVRHAWSALPRWCAVDAGHVKGGCQRGRCADPRAVRRIWS